MLGNKTEKVKYNEIFVLFFVIILVGIFVFLLLPKKSTNLTVDASLTKEQRDIFPKDSALVYSEDKSKAVFVRDLGDHRPSEDFAEGIDVYNQLILKDIADNSERVIVDSGPIKDLDIQNLPSSGYPIDKLINISNPIFSLDNKFIYFSAAGWVTSRAIFVYDLDTSKISFLCDGNTLDIITKGPYKGNILVAKHRYYDAPNYGSYDHYYVVNKFGEDILDAGDDRDKIFEQYGISNVDVVTEQKIEERVPLDVGYPYVPTKTILNYNAEKIPTVVVKDYSISFPHKVATSGEAVWDFSENGIFEYEIYKGKAKIGTYKLNDPLSSIDQLTFGDKEIVLLHTFSGGAHCCSTVIPIIIGDNLVIGQAIDLGNLDLGLNSFFVKDDSLYAVVYDDRFAYFHTCYACSGDMFYPNFYQLDMKTGSWLNKSNEFAAIYLREADKMNLKIQRVGLSADDLYDSLVGRAILYRLSGRGIEIWGDFKRDFANYIGQDEGSLSLKDFKDFMSFDVSTIDDIINEAEQLLKLPKNYTISNTTFDQVAQPGGDKYIGQIVRWRGRVADMALTDGVKFWRVDKVKEKSGYDRYDLFWAHSLDRISFEQSTHNWLDFFLKKYGGFTQGYNIPNREFWITGQIAAIDDSYFDADASGQKVYMPNLEIIKIEKL